MTFPSYPSTDRQRKIITLAKDLAQTFAKRALDNDWTGTFSYANYQDLQQSGYLTLPIPQDHGGWGANILELALAQSTLGQGDASTALVTGMHFATLGRLITTMETSDPLLIEIFHNVIQNGALLNNVFSEPSTGSPSRGGLPSTTARRQADGSWRITGRKTYTTGSPVLHYFLVSCQIEDTTELPHIEANRGTFLVKRESAGLQVEETWNSLAMRGSGSHDLILSDVHVPANAHLTRLDNPSPAASERLGGWNLTSTSIYLGISIAARNEALQFARRRQPNSLNQPIASVPHIQDKIARIELALLQSKAVLFGIANQLSTDPTSVLASELAATKYLVINHGVEIVDLAMRVVGGASLSLSAPLQRYYRDIRAGLHHPPMDDATLALLSKQAIAEE